MLPKKCSILLPYTSYTNLGPLSYTHAPRKSCRHTFPRPEAAPPPQRRTYAHHHDAPAYRHDAELLEWPEAVKPHKTPTPYQILRCRRGDAYSKHRFYALVKLYHPDRCQAEAAIAQLPLHVRLERYRMLVAAHDILSDVQKRKAYDAWGHGWAGHHQMPMGPRHNDWHYDPHRWNTDPRTNATWEDWERWHYENGGGAKDADSRAIQMSNFTFMALIFAFVSIGGVVQGTRFNTFNNSVIERRDQIHREASMEYSRSRNATLSASGDRDERIRTFLNHRESTIVGEQSYQRLLPPADTCSPDEIRRQ
jgi:curved DNA-binding protein CbpA